MWPFKSITMDICQLSEAPDPEISRKDTGYSSCRQPYNVRKINSIGSDDFQ
jgi:hypothetical protein